MNDQRSVNIERLVFFLAFFICAGILFPQNPYFQQQVDYRIEVKLDDVNDVLRATETITYTNHSPGSLKEIVFHLWPNAYKDRSTALTRQLLENGSADLYFAKDHERGWIDSLNFSVDGKKVIWNYDTAHPDICRLVLNEPLLPGELIVINTPFRVKIPDAKFSRLGHTGDAFFITQWYPKPAVYDNSGWHPMPYLDQGEFYSEFGNFDVTITLPANYVVATSGDLADAPEEELFLAEKVKETRSHIAADSRRDSAMNFPPSSAKFKTLRFVQQNVHDFAWFADKRFYVLNGEVLMPDDRSVKTWVFFTDKNFSYWKNAVDYVKAATVFYTQKVGIYPYRHVTAVDGTIMAGGGMEYPAITVIGDVSTAFELDMVIAHEVGHNWFYGILGSNERDHPFLDEGINSFYETRYIKERYREKNLSMFLGREKDIRLFGINKVPVWKYHDISYLGSARQNNDQPLDLSSEKYSETNYGSVVYSKSALALEYLMDFLGEENFDQAMRNYYLKYQFKHPSPADFFETLENNTHTDLSWFKENMYHANKKVDYKITRTNRSNGGSEVTFKNKTGTPVPFKVTAFDKENKSFERWLPAVTREEKLRIPVPQDRFVIDVDYTMPDMNRKNNSIKTSGIFKHRKPFRPALFTSLEQADVNQVFFAPVTGINHYNGFMAGLVIHNYGFIQKPVEWHVSPMFGFNSNDVNGNAEFNWHLFPKHTFRQITFGAKFKRYGYDYVNNQEDSHIKSAPVLSYIRLSPFISVDLKKKNARSTKQNKLTYYSHLLAVDSLVNGSEQIKTARSFVNELAYYHTNTRALNPYSVLVDVQHTASMGKLGVTYTQKFTLTRKKSIHWRVFAGSFFAGSFEERSYYAFRASGYNGWHDYLFEANYLGRNDRSGIAFNQFTVRDGGMKTYTPFGQSPTWMLGTNLLSPRFFGVFRGFADIVFCDRDVLYTQPFVYSVGLNLVLWEDIMEVYFPLFMDTGSQSGFDLNHPELHERIRFTFNIHKLDTKKILQSSWN